MHFEENYDNLGTEKVDDFVVQQKFSPIDKSKLKVFDQILDTCHLEYTKALQKKIEN